MASCYQLSINMQFPPGQSDRPLELKTPNATPKETTSARSHVYSTKRNNNANRPQRGRMFIAPVQQQSTRPRRGRMCTEIRGSHVYKNLL